MFIFLGEAYTAAKLSILPYNEQIKEARKHKNLRQKYLALNLGLPPLYIQRSTRPKFSKKMVRVLSPYINKKIFMSKILEKRE